MRHPRGFTLVELLVVTGIIVVLAGLLLSVASGARQSAAAAACLSNLRQMAAAATDYATRNRGSYPPAQWFDPAEPSVFPAWDYTNRGGVVTSGYVFAPHPVTAVQQCPSFDGRANSAGDPFTGYNYNTSYIGRGAREAVEAPARMAQVKNPSQTLLFGDGQWRLGANKYMRAPRPSPFEDAGPFAKGSATRAAGTQGFRHQGATNAGFCDGHAEALRSRTDAGNSNVAEGTGFVADPARPDDPNAMYDLE